jgi:MraZ protein
MISLSGKFKGTLDDKGRISLPAPLRRALNESNPVLTHGYENCLWLFPSEHWQTMAKTILETTTPFSANSRRLRRDLLGPSHAVEIDKAGRIPVAQSLREYAHLSGECVILGIYEYVEIWSEELYNAYEAGKENDNDLAAGSQEIHDMLIKKRGLSS